MFYDFYRIGILIPPKGHQYETIQQYLNVAALLKKWNAFLIRKVDRRKKYNKTVVQLTHSSLCSKSLMITCISVKHARDHTCVPTYYHIPTRKRLSAFVVRLKFVGKFHFFGVYRMPIFWSQTY